jgi:membrane-associated phospholipid phosphatase
MTSTEIAVADATAPQPPAAPPAGVASPDAIVAQLEVAVAQPDAVVTHPDATVAPPDATAPDVTAPEPAETDLTAQETGLTVQDAAAVPVAVAPLDPGAKTGWWTLPRQRILSMIVWGVLFLGAWMTIGIPTDPVEAFVWIWAGTVAWNIAKPWRSHLRFPRDWAAIIVLLVVYNISRGWASVPDAHITPMIDADKWMFGWATGGEIPTMWLQHHLYHPLHAQWYEILASSVYFSHFVMALLVAALLWMTNRDRWLSFVRRWFTLTAFILATYFLYPATPPWLASQDGYLPGPLQVGPDGYSWTVVRLSTRGWDALGLHHAGSLLNAAQVQEANPVAAMPSMHSAYAMLIVAFFLPAVRRRWWPLMLCYPLAMTFALVYSGEHYMIDVLMGWVYVLVTFVLVRVAEKQWAAFQARRAGAVPIESGPSEPVPSELVIAQRQAATR